MLAPSEKHLQDYLWDHPETFWLMTGGYEKEDIINNLYRYSLFKREAILPSGRADFLATDNCRMSKYICVVETKKEEINIKTVTQCLRYMHDIRRIWSYALIDSEKHTLKADYLNEQHISGLLIGSSVQEDTLISAHGADIEVAIYNFDGATYQLKKKSPEWYTDMYKDYAYGYLGEEIRDHRRKYLELLNSVYRENENSNV